MDLPLNMRSPFVPVVKHKSSMSPPSSPSLGHEKVYRAASASSSSTSTMPVEPLGASNAHNLVPASMAPKIRAKVTPAATPRKKQVLPGAGDPDFVQTPVTRKPLPSTSGMRAMGPGSPLKKPVLPTIEEPYLVNRLDEATRGLAGLGLASPFQPVSTPRIFERDSESSKIRAKENVLVCVRYTRSAFWTGIPLMKCGKGPSRRRQARTGRGQLDDRSVGRRSELGKSQPDQRPTCDVALCLR